MLVFRPCLAVAIGMAASSNPPGSVSPQKEKTVTTMQVTGAFEVKMAPQASDEPQGVTPLARMSLDKVFHGGLEATSKGEMLSAVTTVKGSAGYVAIERVTGRLDGREGTFVLQHNGIMNRGTPHLTITVVPDSGTAQLAGLAGKMSIRIEEGGKHFYVFEYTLPDK